MRSALRSLAVIRLGRDPAWFAAKKGGFWQTGNYNQVVVQGGR